MEFELGINESKVFAIPEDTNLTEVDKTAISKVIILNNEVIEDQLASVISTSDLNGWEKQYVAKD